MTFYEIISFGIVIFLSCFYMILRLQINNQGYQPKKSDKEIHPPKGGL